MKRRAQSSPSSVRATALFCLFFFISTIYVSQVVISVTAEVEPAPAEPTVEQNLKGVKVGLKTDDEVVEREERAISSEGYSVAEQKQMRERAQKFAFQAEVNRLMHLIINSLYSNKDIFLRELISNASDALDKIRFLGVQDPTQLGEGELAQLNIRIRADPESNTLTITDKGIGMTKEELIANLGTIAKSGTKEFLEAIAKSADTNLIGQFGVGFYSSFLVADKVVVTSKSNKDDTQWVWESNAENEFSVTEDPKGNTLGRGTRITLHLKEEAKEYLKQDKLKALVTKYSEFINFPIYLWASHEESEEVPVEDDEEEEKVDLGEKSEEETEAEEEDKPKTKTVTKTVWGWELLNQTKPLWTRSPKDITEEEYLNFFKSLSKGVEDPLSYTHFSAEGEVEFKALLYIPGTPPGSMFDTSGKPANRIRLYVRRVFISDQFEDFLPRYLSFIEGIVDSDDLPLNVSREILQQDRTLAMIKKKLVRKIIALFQSLQDEPEKYEQFYEKYHQNLKLGVIEDTSNRARISKLLRFHSSKTATTTTLQEYVDRMKEGQKDIYYLAGESLASLENSPLVERALKSGYEVLYMTDPMDEYTVSHLNRFDNKYPLTNIAKEGIKFDEEESAKEEQKANEQEFKTLTDFLKTALTSKISKAIVSDRLVRAPAALASGAFGFTANMERLMKAQAFVDQKQLEFMKSQRVLEINPKHPLIVELNKRIKENAGDEVNDLLAEVLYETAALQSGFNIDDPAAFASGVHKLLKLSLNIDVNAEAPEEATSSRSTADAEPVADERDEL